MENYEDDPVTLTCRSKLSFIRDVLRKKLSNTPREEIFKKTCFGWLWELDDSTENCVLIHFMISRQVERASEETEVDPLVYHVNDRYIEFGRDEFCLITGLRFGPEYSERYKKNGPNLFRRHVFNSDIDSGHVSCQMVVDMINSEEFDDLHDEDAVSLCQLAVLHLVLLGRQLSHNIPEWWFRLIADKKTWEIYPWGSVVWRQLYNQLENANWERAEHLYADDNNEGRRRNAKYSLSGFTYAFKTWILETYKVEALQYYTNKQRYPRAVAWDNFKYFIREYLAPFFDGARPNRRMRPDAFERNTEWWISSQQFFEGRIREAPPIPTHVDFPSRYDIPKYVDQRIDEVMRYIKEKVDQVQKLSEVHNHSKGKTKLQRVEVHEHYGLSDFNSSVPTTTPGFRQDGPKDGPKSFTNQPTSSFFNMTQMTLNYSSVFKEPVSSRHPISTYPGTPSFSADSVRQTIINILGSQKEYEVRLANKLTSDMSNVEHRMHTRETHMKMLHAMPITSLSSYGLHALLMTHESDIRIAQNLKTTREELLRSIHEKQRFINNYREI